MISIETNLIQEYSFIKSFYSKRNKVWLIENKENNKKMVFKKFSCKKGFKKELEVYNYLLKKGCNVPKLYQVGLDYIVMEYVNSITLYDYIMKCENENKNIDMKIMLSLIKELEGVYHSNLFKSRRMILNDINLRNFLVNEEEVYIIDFEGTDTKKDILTDMAGFIAFFLTYNPCFSQWKLQELKRLIIFLDRRYVSIDYGSIKKELVKWIEFLEKRRNMNYIEGYNKNIKSIFHNNEIINNF